MSSRWLNEPPPDGGLWTSAKRTRGRNRFRVTRSDYGILATNGSSELGKAEFHSHPTRERSARLRNTQQLPGCGRGRLKKKPCACTQLGGSQASEKTLRGDDCVAGHIGLELQCAKRKFISLNVRQYRDLPPPEQPACGI